MAQVPRTAKSGNKWTDAELIAYDISVIPTPPSHFFESVAVPSLDHLDPGILTPNIMPNPNLSDCAQQFLFHLDNAIHSKQASAIVDFAAETLSFLRFGDNHSTVATRYPIHLWRGPVCSSRRMSCISSGHYPVGACQGYTIIQSSEHRATGNPTSNFGLSAQQHKARREGRNYSRSYDHSLHCYVWHASHVLPCPCNKSTQRCRQEWSLSADTNSSFEVRHSCDARNVA